MNKILAIVVTYYPEKELLERNVQAFIDHVDKVLIWENTPSPDKLDYRFIEHEKVVYYGDGINSISRALNYAWEYANENGFDYLLTMDQDSYFENFDYYVSKTVLSSEAPEGIWTVHGSCRPVHPRRRPLSSDPPEGVRISPDRWCSCGPIPPWPR